jgi:hypothetical protein
MFSISTFLPTRQPTQNPSIVGLTVNPSQNPTTLTPSFRPTTLQPSTLQPSTLQPSTLQPSTLQPTLNPTLATTNFPTSAGVGFSSMNSASNSQTGLSNIAIGAVVGCVILVILIIVACLFFTKKNSKTPYKIW